MRIAYLNGSVRGARGNTHALGRELARLAPASCEVRELVLSRYEGTVGALHRELSEADALCFATGVYWSSWGSPLQRFFEVMSRYELGEAFLGKPAACLVTMDSVGGADVAQRLAGVLTLFGCLLPPLSSVVLSRVGVEAAMREGNEDVWRLTDLEPLLGNLLAAAALPRAPWKAWPVGALDWDANAPYPAPGEVELGFPPFLGV